MLRAASLVNFDPQKKKIKVQRMFPARLPRKILIIVAFFEI